MAKSQQHYVPHAQPEYETEPPAWTNDVDPEIFGMYELSMDQQLEILQRRPQHRAQILKYLQETFGNQHVHELVQRLDAPVATPTPAAAETAAAEATTAEPAYEPIGDGLMRPDFDTPANDTDLIDPYAEDRAPVVREAEVQPDPEQTVRAIEELPAVTKPEPETVHIEMEPEVIEVAASGAGKTAEKDKPAWVVGAERYNFNHPKYVDEFLENTKFACYNDDTGEPDVYAVADWQVKAGLKPDGRIGPDTVDCSRIEILEEPAVAPEPLPDNVA